MTTQTMIHDPAGAATGSRLAAASRILLGGLFLLFGLDGFLGFLPLPAFDGAAGDFMAGLKAAPHFMPLLKATEIAAGLLLLSGRLVPLALVVLAPVVLHVGAFHLFLAPAGLPVAGALLAAGLHLAWIHRETYRALLAAR
jgi:uncharacterized membrane protein YphA (DoxX/SURF4 family)